jgi:hypothetical protein
MCKGIYHGFPDSKMGIFIFLFDTDVSYQRYEVYSLAISKRQWCRENEQSAAMLVIAGAPILYVERALLLRSEQRVGSLSLTRNFGLRDKYQNRPRCSQGVAILQ